MVSIVDMLRSSFSEGELRFGEVSVENRNGKVVLVGTLEVKAPVAFLIAITVEVGMAEAAKIGLRSSDTKHMHWLPRGSYRFECTLPPSGQQAVLSVGAWHQSAMAMVQSDNRQLGATLSSADPANTWEPGWTFAAIPPTASLDGLSWNKGYADWFYRHFDHAATTCISYLLGDSPLLRGDILDIGCGEGITDLGIALRTKCKRLVGVDPFRQFERLADIVKSNGLPSDFIPRNLSFLPEDANFLPFEDDSFDVVISWGSVEHIAGGYLQVLREVKRVLRPDGLFLVAPGLFYSNIGHHLDEFSDEPFFHLKKSPEEVKRMVLETPPRYIDRAGEFASNEQYWQWHCELNRITVTEFEKQIRALEFEPWRVALRTTPLVEYTPELQGYSFEQLANTELYMSCVNRKRSRGK